MSFPGLVLAAVFAAAAPSVRAQATESLSTRLSDRRIVKVFDFLEPENHERVPMHWEKLSRYGFPHFVRGQFDHQVGHEAPPSFCLSSKGANVAYSYHWRDIPVKPGSHYEVRGLIRTRDMPHAQAYVSAYFTDRYGRKLPGSERFSRAVGGRTGDSDWQPVVVRLAGQYPSARLIGLTLWITQESVWSRGPIPPRRIEKKDVGAVAWFDDLEVRRLPQVAIAAAGNSPLFRDDRPVGLEVAVSDPDALNISAEMLVYDSDGHVVLRQPVAISTDGGSAPQQITLPDLRTGLYRAEVAVHSRGELLSRTDSGFAVIGPPLASRRPGAGRFGVILDEARSGQWLANQVFLRELAVGHVKVAIRGDDWATPSATAPDESFDQLLQWLARNRMDVVAELREPTFPPTAGGGGLHHGLLDMLSGEPAGWPPYVPDLLSRYADMVSAWQIAADGDTQIVWDDRLVKVLSELRRQLGELMFDPRLAVTWSIEHQFPRGLLPGDYLSIRVPAEVAPAWIEGYWASLPADHAGRYWAYVESPAADRYARRVRLADYAERLVAMLHTGADVIFVAQPWRWDGRGEQARPSPEFLVLRTVAALLGEARWVGTVHLDERTTAQIFDREDGGVLVVQDKSASDRPRTLKTYLGPGARVIDLQGRILATRTGDGKTELAVSAEPVFVDGIKTWLMRVRGSIGLDDEMLETTPGLQTRTVRFYNHASFPIGGVLRLAPPRFWEVKPSYFPFHLRPGESFRRPVTIRVPNNESAGDKLILARMTLETGTRASFTVPIPIELGIRDVEVATIAVTRDDVVVVRQTVTNRSKETLSFDGFVSAPGRARVSRLIRHLAPGQTVTTRYHLARAEELIGRSLRVGLREIRGHRRYRQVVVVP